MGSYGHVVRHVGRGWGGDMTKCWNEDVKEAIIRKKDGCKVMCQNSTEENMNWYEGMKNKAKAVSKALMEKAVVGITDLKSVKLQCFC